jgi:hypothetical protein
MEQDSSDSGPDFVPSVAPAPLPPTSRRNAAKLRPASARFDAVYSELGFARYHPRVPLRALPYPSRPSRTEPCILATLAAVLAALGLDESAALARAHLSLSSQPSAAPLSLRADGVSLDYSDGLGSVVAPKPAPSAAPGPTAGETSSSYSYTYTYDTPSAGPEVPPPDGDDASVSYTYTYDSSPSVSEVRPLLGEKRVRTAS